MLLTEEQIVEHVNKIIVKAQSLLQQVGAVRTDAESGFTHTECHIDCFIMIEHQRQQIDTGFIDTNGLDIWMINDGNAKKVLSANYVPFQIHFFDKAGKAEWIERILSLEVKDWTYTVPRDN